MNLASLPNFTKRVVRASARRANGLIHLLKARKRNVIFLFGGRTNHWPGMGHTLYMQEPVFRASIQETCQLIEELSGEQVLSNFAGPHDPDFFTGNTRVMFSIMALQLALTDLWMDKGIRPEATMGVSLGEVTAVYAAGGLTRQDVVRICTAWYMVSQWEEKDYLSIYVNVDLATMQTLRQRCPAPLAVVYEAGPESFLVFCRTADKSVVTTLLDENRVSWSQPFPDTSKPFHTPRFNQHRQYMREYLHPVRPQPLLTDFYSSTLGRMLPAGSLVPVTLWSELVCLPVMLYTTLQQVINDQYRVVLNVGPHPFLTGQTQKRAFDITSACVMLDSMRHQHSERDVFQQTHRRLRLLNWRNQLLGNRPKPDDLNPLTRFTQQLNLASPAAMDSLAEIYAHLRSMCRVCYLPIHQAWLVVTYDDVNYVLQHPELFSSQYYQPVDPFLLGADAPNHTQIRAIVQPLFAPQAIAELSTYIESEFLRRLTHLSEKEQFDAVADLTLPFVQSVIVNIMGLPPVSVQQLQALLDTSLSDRDQLDKLTIFFRSYLETKPANRLGGLLMAQVQAGELPIDGAVSLMRLLWLAGTTTTSVLLSNLLNALIGQPHLADQLKANEELIPKFVEECLRLEPPETTVSRITTQDTILADQTIPAGSTVILGLAGANRDPLIFARPDEWLLTRPARRHLSLGAGYHHCLGAGLARLEAKLFVQSVLTHMPQLRNVEIGPPAYAATHLRGLARLVVSPSKQAFR